MSGRDLFISRMLLPVLLVGTLAGTGAAQDAAPDTGDARRVVTGDRTIGAGEVVQDIVVIGGDLRVRGEVTGDAVVVGGDLILESSGTILGDAIVTAGRLVNEGGRIRGEMRTVEGAGLDVGEAIERATGGATASVDSDRSERARVVVSASSDRRRDGSGFFGPIRRGFAGIISTLALGLVLAGIGATLVFYGRPFLETVSDTVRSSTVRSAATGLAASFLALPAFVVLVVALAVSIIGIPFLLVAVPLYPVALFAGAVFGLLAVSHAIGERTAEQSRDGLDFRSRNSYAYLFTGLGMLLMPLVAAHLIAMTGFLGFIGTLLKILTWMAIWCASTIGFGGVILSRAGTRRTFVTPLPDTSFDADDFFADDPTGRPGHA